MEIGRLCIKQMYTHLPSPEHEQCRGVVLPGHSTQLTLRFPICTMISEALCYG